MKKKSFLIIGAGSFGKHLCRCMAAQGAEIMVVDQVDARVEELLPYAVSGKVGDCTNPEVLRSFGVADFDACFVCTGENFQNSLVITDQLKELGAKKVFSEAGEDMQEKFLRLGGADHVVFPEKDVAARLAVSECYDSIFDYIALAGDYGIFELEVPTRWADKSLRELNVRATYSLNILASRQDAGVQPIVDPDYRLTRGEHILVMGHIRDVRRATE